jgi:hypothetical protein
MAGIVTLEAVQPVKVRFRSDGSQFDLRPGDRVDLPEMNARRLLQVAPEKVRRVDDSVTIEPAHPKARPVYFEDALGRILGPVVPEFLARAEGHFWIITTFDGLPRWIRSDRLRSKRQFEAQPKTRIVEPVPRSL